MIKPSKGIVLTPRIEPFKGWADAFRKHYKFQLGYLEEGNAKSSFLSNIRKAAGPLEVVAYFGHAWIFSLISANIGIRDIPKVAEVIQSKSSEGVIVLLYCCGTGTRGGIAEQLQTAIGPKAVVCGHEKAMNAHVNPYKRRYPKGEWIVVPDSPLWCRWLQIEEKDGWSGTSTLWMRYAFMTEAEIHKELEDVTTPKQMKTYPKFEPPIPYKCKK